MASAVTKKFLPPQEVFDNLQIREQEQFPLIIGSNLVFMLMFTLFGIAIAVVTALECFGAPFIDSNFLPYRDSCFIVAAKISGAFE